MNKKIFKALSMKDALDVYFTIYSGCSVEYYVTFEDLLEKINIKKDSLRRITNSLSRHGLIKSVGGYRADKRKKVYVVTNADLPDLILKIVTLS